MPLYEYACTRCGGKLEVLRRVGQGAAGLSCPECGSTDLERELSTFASRSGDGCAPGAGFT